MSALSELDGGGYTPRVGQDSRGDFVTIWVSQTWETYRGATRDEAIASAHARIFRRTPKPELADTATEIAELRYALSYFIRTPSWGAATGALLESDTVKRALVENPEKPVAKAKPPVNPTNALLRELLTAVPDIEWDYADGLIVLTLNLVGGEEHEITGPTIEYVVSMAHARFVNP